jgi:hypothetical protein
MTGEESRQATVAAERAFAEECLAESRFALEGGFFASGVPGPTTPAFMPRPQCSRPEANPFANTPA